MPRVSANGVEIEYERFGDPDDPVLVLVNGLGGQLISWRDELCGLFCRRGFGILRFDNRDSGLSTKMSGSPEPDILGVLRGDRSSVAYTLDDMADDVAGLIDALALGAVHLMGASMGGMIVQNVAIRHPDLVRSLCSIMSTPSPTIGLPSEDVVAAIVAEPPPDRDGAVEHTVELARIIESPRPLFDEARTRAQAAREYDRSFCPEGTARQLQAIVASGDRTEALAGVTAPTLVVHGEADVLVTPAGGTATASAVPGARLLTIPGMGHDLPPAIWPRLVDAVVANAMRAETVSGNETATRAGTAP